MENNKTPSIRFKGFTDPWEQRKFGDVVQITMGQSPDGSTYSDEPSDYILVQGNADLQNGWVCPRVWTTQITKKADAGDLIMSVRAPAGAMGKTAYNAVIGRGVAAIKGNEFIYQLLIKMDKEGYWKKDSTGSTFESLNSSSIKNAEIKLPTLEEQNKIGEYFLNLDNLITLHQRKYNKLLNVKKSMLEKMFPKNESNIPEIRFKGFADPWEQRKLGDILISLQNNTLSRADLSNEAGVAKNVHYGDVLIKFGEVLDVSKEKLPMISDESVLSKYKSSFLQNGDVIVADTAEDSTVGKCSEIAGLNDEVVLSGLHTIPYRPIEKFASGYLGYYLNSSAYHNHLIPLMQGIKVTSISKSAMQDTDIVYPKSVEEQGKIGDYFQSLDHLITLHQRELEKLQNIKKSMLEKMFV
jgi:type I restriction enzyme S subunit